MIANCESFMKLLILEQGLKAKLFWAISSSSCLIKKLLQFIYEYRFKIKVIKLLTTSIYANMRMLLFVVNKKNYKHLISFKKFTLITLKAASSEENHISQYAF